MSNDSIVYINGKYVHKNEALVSVFDRGILYGDGFFEGIRIYNGKIFMCDEHIDRFFDSSKYTNIILNYSKDEIVDIIEKLIEMNNVKDGYIRLVATRGAYNLGLTPPTPDVANPTLICIVSNITLYDRKFYDNGMNAIFSSFTRIGTSMLDPQCKSLNYMLNILAKMEANNRGAQEAIFLNSNGIVTECTGDNIFIIKDDVVYTPPSYTGILNGITRILIIKILKKLGYDIREQEFTRYNVYTADECFLTGTAAEVISVVNIDGRLINDGKVGPHTKIIMNEYKKYIDSVCN
ncbi:branched-chain-amino-acid transaminase [Candidatus Arthromitus sp. SFB-rat-Yit]|uniref:branched-chain-amino-acid transaminase n=1 Tax=Candidatus Arthromitus sp. SFB-rat-Yit TaxID=1041504 RepID=UPI000227A561|nr:branched-chain-amino-acid transaminase [Candidatus Arthromitus sp. SFB-rat-Yit]BAK81013.1 branched-chain amino acid aminotransferase [Candidatus Arthromitus sp. SFB-rat-Yit]